MEVKTISPFGDCVQILGLLRHKGEDMGSIFFNEILDFL